MAFYPVDFRPLGMEANPLTSMNMAQEMLGQMIKNRYAPQQNQLDIESKQLANALSQATLPYAGPTAAADLAVKQAMPDYYRSEAASNYAGVPQKEAQAQLLQEQAKYFPLDTLIKAQQAAQQGSRFGGAYQLAKSLNEMPIPARAAWIAQNQEPYNQMLADLGNRNTSSFITPDVLNKFYPGLIQNQNQNPIQNNPQNSSQGMVVPQMNGGRYFQGSTPEQTAAIQMANNMAANKALTTAATNRQYEGAIQVEGIMNSDDFQNKAKNAALYAGALGKGKAAADALSQNNPQAYEDYLSFKNQYMVLLQNRIKQLDQMGGTDKQRDELHSLYNKTADALASNPSQFLTQINNLGAAIDTVAKSVQKSATPLGNQNRLEGYKQINNSFQNNSSNGSVRVISPDGRSGTIPVSQLDEALRSGYRRG